MTMRAYNSPVQQDLLDNPLPPRVWARIKSLAPSSRLVHVSAEARMIDVPRDIKQPALGTVRVPWVQRPGQTYNVGRNAAKRARRAAARR